MNLERPPDERETERTCSRAGCTSAATATVNWRNPRIHSLDRVKVWLACDEHSDYLRDYLAARDFPVVVASLGTPVDSVPTPTPTPTTTPSPTPSSAVPPVTQ